ncbi:DUF2244 domain-containing protein [Aestuariirhabdus litorea]|uniref:DUF2244 domain-containing protein n=1 Tax=Aestuariirhabdus litorea TaxID=2528527 RepID=A0A3P3VP20_9GAMM|nr:DUF2244 domain-containing protein [Aestuariirhabdus litorea]RRJ84511.1 DUF2244 domain-containing protein [Aestuariirhabdus litorea]RWW97736.1 DUF2244 domain-containing protein [Endozoicomonadaceae bacterium GTF-13]
MVATRITPSNEVQILLRANQSASWRLNLWVWALLSALGSLIALGFSLLGAPLVFPFVGVEVLVLMGAFYCACRDCARQQLIRLGPSRLVVEKGHALREEVTGLPRQWARLRVEPGAHPLGTDRLFLCAFDQRTPVGEFLCQQELEQLRERLRQQGVRVEVLPLRPG